MPLMFTIALLALGFASSQRLIDIKKSTSEKPQTETQEIAGTAATRLPPPLVVADRASAERKKIAASSSIVDSSSPPSKTHTEIAEDDGHAAVEGHKDGSQQHIVIRHEDRRLDDGPVGQPKSTSADMLDVGPPTSTNACMTPPSPIDAKLVRKIQQKTQKNIHDWIKSSHWLVDLSQFLTGMDRTDILQEDPLPAQQRMLKLLLACFSSCRGHCSHLTFVVAGLYLKRIDEDETKGGGVAINSTTIVPLWVCSFVVASKFIDGLNWGADSIQGLVANLKFNGFLELDGQNYPQLELKFLDLMQWRMAYELWEIIDFCIQLEDLHAPVPNTTCTVNDESSSLISK